MVTKQEYTQERFDAQLEEIHDEYQGKYDSQLKHAWNSTKDHEDWQPVIVMRNIKESDPEYRKNLKKILDLRKRPLGSSDMENLVEYSREHEHDFNQGDLYEDKDDPADFWKKN